MKKIRLELVLIILSSIIFGFLAGILGYSLSSSQGFTIPFWHSIDFSSENLGQVLIDQPRNVVVSQDLRLKQIEHELFPSLVNIYPAQTGGTPLNQIYLPEELLAQGFVLTTDGWIVTAASGLNNAKIKYQAVDHQLKEYGLGDFIYDSATEIVLAKIPADGLAVAKIGSSNDLVVGQTVVLAFDRNNVIPVNIRDIGYDFSVPSGAVLSSEKLVKEIFLDYQLDESLNGAVVVNLKAEIIGLVAGGRVVPVDYFKNIFNQVLSAGKISRPVLGIKYIDLAQVEGLSDYDTKGALVYGALDRTSPAYGQLREGDIIKKVNDIELNVYRGLAEIIAGVKPGEEVDLLIARNNQEQTVIIKLK